MLVPSVTLVFLMIETSQLCWPGPMIAPIPESPKPVAPPDVRHVSLHRTPDAWRALLGKHASSAGECAVRGAVYPAVSSTVDQSIYHTLIVAPPSLLLRWSGRRHQSCTHPCCRKSIGLERRHPPNGTPPNRIDPAAVSISHCEGFSVLDGGHAGNLPSSQNFANKPRRLFCKRQIVAIRNHEALRTIERRESVLLAEIERIVTRCPSREDVSGSGNSAASFRAVYVREAPLQV